MAAVDTGELALLALAGDDPESRPAALSVVELSERLGMGAETMADQVALLSTLSELEDRGLVTEHTGGDGTVYSLTEEGRERAARRYGEMADRQVEVRNGSTERIRLGDVDRYLPEPAVVRALSRLTDDDTLYLDEDVDEEFVDREAPLAALTDHIESAREGNGGGVLVVGRAGVGKTTLVERALASVDPDRRLTGVAQGDTDRPYRAIRDAIDPVLPESPFASGGFDPEDPGELEGMRTSLFADVADALVEFAGDEPVVLFVDDLHNAGRSSVELVEYLAGRAREAPLLVVATTRFGNVAGDAVRDLAARWADATAHARVELSPFGREHTRDLVRATLATRRVPDGFVDVVYDHTGGTPLFVAECLSRMQENGSLAPEYDAFPTDPEALAVSDTVEETIDARLESLDDEARTVLATAALLGEEFSVDRLAAAAPLDAATVREYLDLLVTVDVFARVGDEAGTGRRRFHSGLFRERVADRIPDDDRREYHRRIAAAIDEDDPEAAAMTAHHHEAAGDRERALPAWVAAAEHAESVYAHENALDAYERALSIAREFDDSERVLDLLESVGEVSSLLLNTDRARRAFAYVRQSADDAERRRRAARKLARIQRQWDDDPGAAAETIAGALSLTDGPPSTREECRLLVQRSKTAVYRAEYEAARRDAEAALDLAREIGDPRLRAEALSASFGTEQLQQFAATDEGVLQRGERAAAVFEELGAERRLAATLRKLAHAYSVVGDLQKARERNERASEIDARVGNRYGVYLDSFRRSWISYARCLNGECPVPEAVADHRTVVEESRRLDRTPSAALGNWAILEWQANYDYAAASEKFERTIRGYEEGDQLAGQMWTRTIYAGVHLSAGEYETARPSLSLGVTLCERAANPEYLSYVYRLCGRLGLLRGGTRTGVDAFETALSVATDADHLQAAVSSRAGLAKALLAAGRPGDAAAQADHLRAILDGDAADDDPGAVTDLQPFTKPTIAGRRALALVARERGEHEAALAAIEAGLATARDHDDRLREARLLFESGRTHHERGAPGKAATAVAAARSVAGDLGAFGAELVRRHSDLIRRVATDP